jgi:hypothetical protein
LVFNWSAAQAFAVGAALAGADSGADAAAVAVAAAADGLGVDDPLDEQAASMSPTSRMTIARYALRMRGSPRTP